jgi:hypothetical protein
MASRQLGLLFYLGREQGISCDHVAINDKVTACHMKSVPLADGSLDVVVFSLSYPNGKKLG